MISIWLAVALGAMVGIPTVDIVGDYLDETLKQEVVADDRAKFYDPNEECDN